MTLKKLFKKRRTTYMKNILKYSRYILNDHFVLLLLLIIGAGGFTYQNYLETIQPQAIIPRIFLIGIFFIPLVTGRVTLLLEDADQIYLLPKTYQFRSIFQQMVLIAFGKSLLVMGLFTWLAYPLLYQTIGITLYEVLALILAFMSLKWLNLLTQIFPFFYEDEKKLRKYKQISSIFTLISLLCLFFIHIPLVATGLGILFLWTFYLFFSGKIYFTQTFKWEKMIEAEEKRLEGIYRFIQLFTDVPLIKTRIQRLKWLDPVLNWFSKEKSDATTYYLIRSLVRNTEFNSLIIRLTFIGGLLLAFTKNIVLSLVLFCLFLYMAGFQLLSLYYEVKKVLQFKLYPIHEKQKRQAVLNIIFKVLLMMNVVFTFSSLYSLETKGFILFPVGLIFTYLLTKFYFARRLTH